MACPIGCGRRESSTTPYVAGEADVGFLTVVMDQHQTQWCAANFLLHEVKMHAFFLFGPVHRRHNDLDRGLAKAGFFAVCLQRLFEINIAYGPWANGSIFQQMQEQAQDIVVGMTPDDPLLLALWPRICADKNWRRAEDTDRAARQSFLQSFDALSVVQFKGKRASTARWRSMVQGMADGDDRFHTKLLLLASICARKK